MSSASDLSDAEVLPPATFVSRTTRPPVLVLSSDSEEETPVCFPVAQAQRNVAPRPLGGKTSHPPPRPRGATASRDNAGVSLPKKRAKDPEVVTVRIDPGLLQGGCGGQVLSALQAQETPCVIQSQTVPRSITWTRTCGEAQAADTTVEEDDIIILVPMEEFVTMVHTSRKEPHCGSSMMTLSSFVAHIMSSRSGKAPTMVVMEVEKYFKEQKGQSRKKMREAVRGETAGPRRKKGAQETLPVLSRVDIEETLIQLELCTGAHVWFLETWKEFSDFVCMFTKAITEAPTKRQRDNSSFSFYLDGEWAGGIRVDRCGNGLLEVWRRQFQQFNRVSVEIANAVVASYPSPQLLVQAYRDCRTESQCHNLLSDILVRRGEGVISTSRRVGPELSKRIYLQLMSLESELSLEVS
ncbi:crossover junction endonuclease EME1 [Bombina bombina]|uniref:crossover junction endonuclease EME1 n=1 Tax=Bombina bombina TaxID=8345 RepID=UPI00235AEF17|nr:crossover junction endonuclease EME1 [Bombina bombina]